MIAEAPAGVAVSADRTLATVPATVAGGSDAVLVLEYGVGPGGCIRENLRLPPFVIEGSVDAVDAVEALLSEAR